MGIVNLGAKGSPSTTTCSREGQCRTLTFRKRIPPSDLPPGSTLYWSQTLNHRSRMNDKQQLQEKDMAMVELLKSGDERERINATNYLYKRFYKGLKWYFLTRLSNTMRDNATNPEDLAITTLTKAFDNIGNYDRSHGMF